MHSPLALLLLSGVALGIDPRPRKLLETLDQDKDGRLSHPELHASGMLQQDEAFGTIDLDGNGYADLEELTIFVKMVSAMNKDGGATTDPPAVPQQRRRRPAVEEDDEDDDSDEQHQQKIADYARKMLGKLDQNNDRRLSEKEMRDGGGLKVGEAKEIDFRNVDVNSDGFVDIAELEVLISVASSKRPTGVLEKGIQAAKAAAAAEGAGEGAPNQRQRKSATKKKKKKKEAATKTEL